MSDQDIYYFLCYQHPNGLAGFSKDGFNHYILMLQLIRDKLNKPNKKESKFIELCVEENWEYAYNIADTRNKEAITRFDLFKKFSKSPKYLELKREKHLNYILNYEKN